MSFPTKLIFVATNSAARIRFTVAVDAALSIWAAFAVAVVFYALTFFTDLVFGARSQVAPIDAFSAHTCSSTLTRNTLAWVNLTGGKAKPIFALKALGALAVSTNLLANPTLANHRRRTEVIAVV